jgi:hypothetical protein
LVDSALVTTASGWARRDYFPFFKLQKQREAVVATATGISSRLKTSWGLTVVLHRGIINISKNLLRPTMIGSVVASFDKLRMLCWADGDRE